MKIRADKIEMAPFMGLSTTQARRILALIPKEWLTDVSEVHISGSLVPLNSRWGHDDASFSPYYRRLTIFARGHTWQGLVTPILSALAAHHCAFERRRDNRLLDADAKKISRIVAPYAKRIIADVSAPDVA